MNRLALATLALLAIPAAATAQVGGYYVAVPAAPPTKPSLMTHDTSWSLKNGAYVAQRAPERDTVLCELVARNVGTLSSFTAGGNAYDADALAKCNAKAK